MKNSFLQVCFILFLFLLNSLVLSSQSQTVIFTHQTVSLNLSSLEHGSTNNKPSSLVFIAQDFGTAGPNSTYPVGVKYENGKWNIAPLIAGTSIPLRTNFNVMVLPENSACGFKHAASATGRSTQLNNSAINGKESAKLIVTPDLTNGVRNPKNIAVKYENNSWYIVNEDGSNIPQNAQFNVLIADKGFSYAINASNVHPQWPSTTIVNHALANGQAGAKLFITHQFKQKSIDSPLSAWWENGRWTVFSTSGTLRDKTEEVFNVYVYSTNEEPCSGGGTVVSTDPVIGRIPPGIRDCAGRIALTVVGEQTWNFETGDLRGWQKTGTAFNNQPTYGDISFNRSAKARNWAKTVPLGGDYWRDLSLPDRPWNNGRQGNYWIGTSDNHPNPNTTYTQRASPTAEGTLTSPTFSFCEKKAVSFLIGGTSGKIQLLAENDGSIVEANATKIVRTGTAFRDPITGREIPRLQTIPVEKIRLNGKEYFVVYEQTLNGSDFFGRDNIIIPDYAAKGIGVIRIIDDVNGYVNFDDLQFHRSERDVPVSPVDNEKAPLWGFVDMHTHPMSHLAFGKKIMHGAPDIGSLVPAGTRNCNGSDFRARTVEEAMGHCNSTHGGWGLHDNGCGNYIRAVAISKALDEHFIYNTNHNPFEGGNVHGDHRHEGIETTPSFLYWPNQSSVVHQQMWWEWTKRAYQGGLRVMVALAVNNELLARVVDGDAPIDDKNSADLNTRNIDTDLWKWKTEGSLTASY